MEGAFWKTSCQNIQVAPLKSRAHPQDTQADTPANMNTFLMFYLYELTESSHQPCKGDAAIALILESMNWHRMVKWPARGTLNGWSSSGSSSQGSCTPSPCPSPIPAWKGDQLLLSAMPGHTAISLPSPHLLNWLPTWVPTRASGLRHSFASFLSGLEPGTASCLLNTHSGSHIHTSPKGKINSQHHVWVHF